MELEALFEAAKQGDAATLRRELVDYRSMPDGDDTQNQTPEIDSRLNAQNAQGYNLLEWAHYCYHQPAATLEILSKGGMVAYQEKPDSNTLKTTIEILAQAALDQYGVKNGDMYSASHILRDMMKASHYQQSEQLRELIMEHPLHPAFLQFIQEGRLSELAERLSDDAKTYGMVSCHQHDLVDELSQSPDFGKAVYRISIECGLPVGDFSQKTQISAMAKGQERT